MLHQFAKRFRRAWYISGMLRSFFYVLNVFCISEFILNSDGSCSRSVRIANSTDHSGLGNCFVCKRFTVQTLLRSLEFVIQINLEHDTIAVWNLTRSWRSSSYEIITKKINRWKILKKINTVVVSNELWDSRQ